MWFHKLFQDLSHEGETINVDIGEMASQRSIQMWQYFNDEQPPPRRTCTRATVEYNSIYHNNGKEVGEVPPRVIVLTLRVIDCGFKPQLGQTNDYEIGICCLSALRVNLLTWNRDNVSEWSDISLHRLLFQRADIVINLFLPWCSWKITHSPKDILNLKNVIHCSFRHGMLLLWNCCMYIHGTI
jgi:hypothetical protein